MGQAVGLHDRPEAGQQRPGSVAENDPGLLAHAGDAGQRLDPDALAADALAAGLEGLFNDDTCAHDLGSGLVDDVDEGVQGAADVPQAAASLVTKVDCVNNFTDNNVVSNLTVLLEQANSANVPVYGSEIEQVINGCIGSVSIDYVALGKATADMGIRVLGGESAGTIPIGKISDGTAVVNTDVMANFGITLPDSYADAEKVTSADKAE